MSVNFGKKNHMFTLYIVYIHIHICIQLYSILSQVRVRPVVAENGYRDTICFSHFSQPKFQSFDNAPPKYQVVHNYTSVYVGGMCELTDLEWGSSLSNQVGEERYRFRNSLKYQIIYFWYSFHPSNALNSLDNLKFDRNLRTL